MIGSALPALAAALFAATAPSHAPAAIVVDHPELRATLPGQHTAAAYMVVRNLGRAPDRLVGASCACAGDVQAHKTVTVRGVATMALEASVVIPPGKAVDFVPNGRHLMLTGVKAPIPAGASVPMVLIFQKAGRVRVAFKAVDDPQPAEAGAAGAAPAHDMAHMRGMPTPPKPH